MLFRSGKNASVIDAMRARIEQEQQEFDSSTAKIHAVRAVHLKMLRELFHQLGARSLKAQLAELSEALQPKGLKMGVRKVYGETFARVRTIMEGAQTTGAEIQAMLGGTFRQLNTEFGFSLQVPPAPQLDGFVHEIADIEQRHLQYVGMGNTLRLAQPEFAQRLLRALGLRLRTVFESAANELELWSKSATSQLDAQLRERKRSFARRIEAVNRIQEAASGLMDRIAEIEDSERELGALEARLQELTVQMLPPAGDAAQARPEIANTAPMPLRA